MEQILKNSLSFQYKNIANKKTIQSLSAIIIEYKVK
jgi:hypothetical protein